MDVSELAAADLLGLYLFSDFKSNILSLQTPLENIEHNKEENKDL